MTLIATARALDDQRFLWRVRAAALTVATQKAASTDTGEASLSASILGYPMRADPTMEAMVAANPTISAAVTVDAGNTVSTEAVLDADIVYAVTEAWPLLAARQTA